MEKYILGIDSTFHVAGIGLIDENGKVIVNESMSIDFTNKDAKDFFNFHNESILSLVKPVLEKYSEDIFLISASCKDGPFHSMPVGAIIANSISYLSNKKIIGVKHDVAHLYSNRLDRKNEDFIFPIISLNISGAHSNIYLIRDNWKYDMISEITWTEDERIFGGLGASFDFLCHLLNMQVKKGDGGRCFEKLAKLGNPVYKKSFSDLVIEKNGNNFNFKNTKPYFAKKIEDLKYQSLADKEKIEEFKRNFASSVLDVLFDLLIESLAKTAKDFGAREIHLAGGAAANDILTAKLSAYCKNFNLNFKKPLKPDYCGDNGAMVAIHGYYKWKNLNPNEYKKFLDISPSEWYYKYYMYLKFRNIGNSKQANGTKP
jgi:N6-L-threonylcarbamoyladenine synthase